MNATTEYLFVQTYPGRRTEVATAMRTIDGVLDAVETTGPYDILARVEVDDEIAADALARIARSINGVLRVLTAHVAAA